MFFLLEKDEEKKKCHFSFFFIYFFSGKNRCQLIKKFFCFIQSFFRESGGGGGKGSGGGLGVGEDMKENSSGAEFSSEMPMTSKRSWNCFTQ